MSRELLDRIDLGRWGIVRWLVREEDEQHQELEGYYAVRQGHAPQLFVLRLSSGYLRLLSHADMAWGTSVMILPAFWERGVNRRRRAPGSYVHGGKLRVEAPSLDRESLVLPLTGEVQDPNGRGRSRLCVAGRLVLEPPQDGQLVAWVEMAAKGALDLQREGRERELFKPVFLSSMYSGPQHWDCRQAFVDDATYPVPAGQWLVEPPALGRSFGLCGGRSHWQRAKVCPSVEVVLEEPAWITGWVTPSANPNHDNVGMWAVAPPNLRTWRYSIIARHGL